MKRLQFVFLGAAADQPKTKGPGPDPSKVCLRSSKGNEAQAASTPHDSLRLKVPGIAKFLSKKTYIISFGGIPNSSRERERERDR